MRNPVSFKIDPDFRDFIFQIQEQRVKAKTERKQKNLTEISRACFIVLNNQKNIDRLLKIRIPT